MHSIPAYAPLITSPVTIFLTVMAIIVAVPMLLGKLKIPNVIGLILAGVLVGPYALNLLARDMSFEVFGQVGILWLMFLAGIEIDMYNLKRNINRGLIFGLYTFLIPLGLGVAAAVLLLHLDVPRGLLLGSMFAAHTLIAYPIVARFGIANRPSVVIAIAGTIVTVLGALIVLAAVVGGYKDVDSWWALFKLLVGLTAFCLAVVYIYPRLTRWMFKSYGDGVTQFIYVLVMVFLAAAVAQAIGIEGVFGAFFAGLVLNRYIPARSVLMVRLEFVGNAIFIPYFLIGVGMLIDVKVVAHGWETLYVAGVMCAVAMAAKWIAAYLAQKTFRMSNLQRSLMYQLSNAHTAVALAVVTIGYSLDLFDVEILNGTIVMILVTCTVSSIGVERAASRMKVLMLKEKDNSQQKQDTAKKRHERTIVTVANPITAPSLVELAILMRNPSAESELVALHVRNDDSPQAREMGRNSLEIAEKTAAAAEADLTTVERFDYNFTSGVLNAVIERDATGIILGLHRRSRIIDTFFGDKIEQLVRGTDRMVVITRCFIPASTLTRIIVGVPRRAEHESGFRRWVESIGALGYEVGCRVLFYCHPDTAPLIRGVLRAAEIEVRAEYYNMRTYDDFILLAQEVKDDDLFVVVSARRASVSFTAEIDDLPDFLGRNFERNNLMVLYPGQQGTDEALTMATAMSADLSSTPSRLWLMLRDRYRAFRRLRRRLRARKR